MTTTYRCQRCGGRIAAVVELYTDDGAAVDETGRLTLDVARISGRDWSVPNYGCVECGRMGRATGLDLYERAGELYLRPCRRREDTL